MPMIDVTVRRESRSTSAAVKTGNPRLEAVSNLTTKAHRHAAAAGDSALGNPDSDKRSDVVLNRRMSKFE